MFRSKEMTMCQIIMSSDMAFNCIADIGELELVHFCDLNVHTNAFDKKFIHEIRTCDEIERKLRFVEKELQKNNIDPIISREEPVALRLEDLRHLEFIATKTQEELSEVIANAHELAKSQCELVELKHVLNTVYLHLHEVDQDNDLARRLSQSAVSPLEEEQDASAVSEEANHPEQNDATQDTKSHSTRAAIKLSRHNTMLAPTLVNVRLLSGVILARKLSSFELTIWRASRGNAFLRYSSIKKAIEDPMTGEMVAKVVFLIFFQGDKLREKIEKICEGFQANIYSCPDQPVRIQRVIEDVSIRQIDLSTVLSSTEQHCRQLLLSAAQEINSFFIQVRKTKAIYHVLNMCRSDVARQSLLAECWIPKDDLELVRHTLKVKRDSGGDVTAIINVKRTAERPPTHFQVNKLTSAYQALVDAYGIADYQEINPVPFSIVTFPFLFALMFGDFGHALIMLFFAAYMCAAENRLKKKWVNNEVWQIVFSGRYVVLLMALFSLYTGLIYNDALSKAANIFGSQWRVNFSFNYMSTHATVTLEPDPYNRMNSSTWVQMFSGNPYVFGLDPVWALSLNKINYFNSMKMKMSIIIGVSQMILGLFLHLANILYFKRRMDIFFDFLPKLIFFICMFFYLIILIFYKWIMYNGSSDQKFGAACAPSLLVHYINMFLFSYPPPNSNTTDCSAKPFYGSQQAVQTLLVIIAVMCVPLMLIPKPAIEIYKLKKLQKAIRHDSLVTSLLDMASDSGHETNVNEPAVSQVAMESYPNHNVEPEHSTSDVIMNHSIETIEFFLNSISSAASYLRLWALSLAHAELAEVLWDMVMHLAFVISNNLILKSILVFIVFYAWALLTLAILVVMEGLSAFLHVLRLHWVEFQGKFYRGTGFAFNPLRLKSIADNVNFGDVLNQTN